MIDLKTKYKTRDGQNVRIPSIDGSGYGCDSEFPVSVLIDGNGFPQTYTSTGEFYNSGKNSSLDLVKIGDECPLCKQEIN